jgi:tRNA(fMet)-specific endonuclease VapC
MSYLLDADWIISYLNGRTEAVELINRLADEGLAVSTIVAGEIYEGLLSGPDADRRTTLFQVFTSSVRLLAPDDDVAQNYARIRSELRGQGQLLADNDLWIAATAMAYRLTLVSRDQHFKRIPGIELL